MTTETATPVQPEIRKRMPCLLIDKGEVAYEEARKVPSSDHRAGIHAAMWESYYLNPSSPKADRIAQAIGDPGSIVGRRFGPSWGEGNEGYAPETETVPRWCTRAVLAVLAEREAGR